MTERRALPLLMHPPTPCTEPWDGMVGSDLVRHCARCEKDVFDLSAMHRSEIDALFADNENGACVRFYLRADGTVSTADCAPVKQKVKHVRRVAVRLAGVGLLILTGAAASALAERACRVRVYSQGGASIGSIK